jgi:protein TonB
MDINKILKSDYLDILFEGRNKDYGGYELRRNYPKRVRNSAYILMGLSALLVLVEVVSGMKHKSDKPVISMKEVTLAEPPPIDKTKPPPPPPPPAPPPPVKPTVKFTPPVIKKDEEVKEEEKPTPPPDEKVAVGLENAKGDPNGIDPGLIDKPGTGVVEQPAAPPAPVRFVEQMPEFSGDLASWLHDHLRYPDEARESGVEGRVGIEFIVSEDGSISNVKVVRSAGSSALDAEAVRVVKAMPHWKPGKQQGRAVPVIFTLPITFKLD